MVLVVDGVVDSAVYCCVYALGCTCDRLLHGVCGGFEPHSVDRVTVVFTRSAVKTGIMAELIVPTIRLGLPLDWIVAAW